MYSSVVPLLRLLVYCLSTQGHSGEVFVLEHHPSDPRVLLTAGHDGLVMVWDMFAGECLTKIHIDGDDGNPAAIFDCKFSTDGLMCAAVDMNGYLTLLGFGDKKEYTKVCGLYFVDKHTLYLKCKLVSGGYFQECITPPPPPPKDMQTPNLLPQVKSPV